MKMKQKKGISGGKAVGAILTGGLSILATGLSERKKECRPTVIIAALLGIYEVIPRAFLLVRSHILIGVRVRDRRGQFLRIAPVATLGALLPPLTNQFASS